MIAIDRNGVIWFADPRGGPCGFVSKAAYNAIREKMPSLPSVEELPPFDISKQNWITIPEDAK